MRHMFEISQDGAHYSQMIHFTFGKMIRVAMGRESLKWERSLAK